MAINENGNGSGAMRRAADKAVQSTSLVLVARAAAISVPVILSFFIYTAADWRQDLKADDDANRERAWKNTELIWETSAALRETVARLEALKDNDKKQDAELLLLRGFGGP